ncbi:hypothetical protein KAR34_09805 [bacterium]|nr:hypothetical protein [bacterium]
MDNQAANTTIINSSPKDNVKRNDGCFMGMAIVAILILALIGVLALVIYLRPASLLRYGIIANLNTFEQRLEQERTLTNEQYEELKIYVNSLKKYMVQSDLDKTVVMRIGPVSEVFKAALKDGKIGRTEIAAIRSAIWKSNIPLDVPPVKPKVAPATKDTQVQ